MFTFIFNGTEHPISELGEFELDMIYTKCLFKTGVRTHFLPDYIRIVKEEKGFKIGLKQNCKDTLFYLLNRLFEAYHLSIVGITVNIPIHPGWQQNPNKKYFCQRFMFAKIIDILAFNPQRKHVFIDGTPSPVRYDKYMLIKHHQKRVTLAKPMLEIETSSVNSFIVIQDKK